MKRVILALVLGASALNAHAGLTPYEQALEDLRAVEADQVATKDDLTALGERVTDLELKQGYASNEVVWCAENPDGLQEVYDSGATRIIVGRLIGGGDNTPCSSLIIDKHPVSLIGDGIKVPITYVEVRNTKAGFFDIGIENLEAYSAQITLSDSTADNAIVHNSTVSVFEADLVGVAFGSTIKSARDVGSRLELVLRSSQLIGDGHYRNGWIKLEAGSYMGVIDNPLASPFRFPNTTVTCDPQTSRIYDPDGLVPAIAFSPAATGTETCLSH